MATKKAPSRREVLGAAKVVGLAAVGVALLPTAARADINDHPALKKSKKLLSDARDTLEAASNGYGGHRKKAMEYIDAALDEIAAGVKFADK